LADLRQAVVEVVLVIPLRMTPPAWGVSAGRRTQLEQ
jgi:hypothetical protein